MKPAATPLTRTLSSGGAGGDNNSRRVTLNVNALSTPLGVNVDNKTADAGTTTTRDRDAKSRLAQAIADRKARAAAEK